MGLLTANYHTTATARQETILANMVQDVVSTLMNQPNGFSDLQSEVGQSTPTTYYFDADGNLLPSIQNSFYACTVGLSYPKQLSNLSQNMIEATCTFTWPSTAPVAQRNSTTLNASLAQF